MVKPPELTRHFNVSSEDLFEAQTNINATPKRDLAESFAADCALLQKLGLRLVVVHGGGPQIGAMLK